MKSQDVSVRPRGLSNLVVWGRSFTNVLQQLRGILGEDFERWYTPYRRQMMEDELMKSFYKLRSDVLKEGKIPGLFDGFIVKGPLSLPDDLEKYSTKPPTSTGAFIDSSGIGWTIVLSDGTEGKYYVDLPKQIARKTVSLENHPRNHLGRRVTDSSLEELGEMYYNYLRRMLDDAWDRFSGGQRRPGLGVGHRRS